MEKLKSFWRQLKTAMELSDRVGTLEAQMSSARFEIETLKNKLGEIEQAEKQAKLPARGHWPQRRKWLEETDGGRVNVGKN